jgi:uncharacterized protein YndB with AHSA1/START domain
MKDTAQPKKALRMSDAAVQAKTGKTWPEWFAILDAAGARQMNHTQIAAHLFKELGCSAWWSQMVAVGYERERGLRDKYQACSGDYKASASKTLPVPLATLFGAWQDVKARNRWLKERRLVIRKATPDKSMRITWGDGQTNVEVNFYAKGGAKSQVAVQHNKLESTAAVMRMKQFWAGALDRLVQFLGNPAASQPAGTTLVTSGKRRKA